MKSFITIIILVFSINLNFAQEKKIIFFNEKNELISKDDFNKLQIIEKKSRTIIEYDSIVVGRLYDYKTSGKLADSVFKNLKMLLSPNVELNNELIVIVYYPGKDPCNFTKSNSTWNIFDSDYLRNLKKITSFHHFWIYKNDEDLEFYYPNKVNWEKDKAQFIEKLFFKFHYLCFSAVVIDRNGNFVSRLGEFGKQNIWEIALELTKQK